MKYLEPVIHRLEEGRQLRAIELDPTGSLTVIPWPDEVIDAIGHDARSRYVEQYWLGVLGPSATWLLRLVADELEASPSGFTMDLEATARQVGLVAGSRNSPFMRALVRLCQFEMAQPQGRHVLAVRRRLPSLSRRHLVRLPEPLRARHDSWQQKQLHEAS